MSEAPSASRPVLHVEGLHKTYRMGESDLHVLKGIDVEVRPGEVLAIMGPSGAGKSTLLHLLGMLDHPSRGRILYHNVDLARMNGSEAARVRNRCFGFVFQFFHLMPELTVLENVAMAAMIGTSSLAWPVARWGAYARARKILRQLGMSHRLASVPNQLSGGERQRVAIARALMNDPEVIFCDEPTGNLDLATATEIQALLRKLNRELGKTIVIVTHDERIAEGAHRIVRLVDGRVAEVQEREPLAATSMTAGAEPWSGAPVDGAVTRGWTKRITFGLVLCSAFLLWTAWTWSRSVWEAYRADEAPLRMEALLAVLAGVSGLGCLLARDLGRRIGFLVSGIAAASTGVPLVVDASRTAAETWVLTVPVPLRFLLALAWVFLLMGAMVARGRERAQGWVGFFVAMSWAAIGGIGWWGAYLVQKRPLVHQEWVAPACIVCGLLFFEGVFAFFLSAQRGWFASAILLPFLGATVLAAAGYDLRAGVHSALLLGGMSVGGLLSIAILGSPTLRKRLLVG